jgi:hypothetical protein
VSLSKDHENTGSFSDYGFNFNESEALLAVNENTTVTGSWSIIDNSAYLKVVDFGLGD